MRSVRNAMSKKLKLSPEVLRQRRITFYHGLPREILRNAACRAEEARKSRSHETSHDVSGCRTPGKTLGNRPDDRAAARTKLSADSKLWARFARRDARVSLRPRRWPSSLHYPALTIHARAPNQAVNSTRD